MKKIFLGALLALSLATAVKADDLSGLLRVMPGSSENKGVVTLGNKPGSVVGDGFVGVALVNITKGDVVVGPYSTTLTTKMGVSYTATAGDVNVFGIAASSANYGVTVTVVTRGLVRCHSAVGVTQRLFYASSGTAGQLTATSSLTNVYTPLSGTPTIVTAIETRANADGLFLGWVGRR